MAGSGGGKTDIRPGVGKIVLFSVRGEVVCELFDMKGVVIYLSMVAGRDTFVFKHTNVYKDLLDTKKDSPNS